MRPEYTPCAFTVNMPRLRVTEKAKSQLEKMKEEGDYQSCDSLIRELIHECADRRIPEASELSERAREEIKTLAREYSGLMGDVDSLPEPVKSVVRFIKRIAEGGEAR